MNTGDSCSFTNECQNTGTINKGALMLEKPFELKFDITPTLIYIQKDKTGIGELFLNGKRVKGLQEITIEAAANTDFVSFPSLMLKVIPETLAKCITEE